MPLNGELQLSGYPFAAFATLTDADQITTNDGSPAVQQRTASFVVDAEPGDRVCITVAVNREGKTGPASGEKCADLPE